MKYRAEVPGYVDLLELHALDPIAYPFLLQSVAGHPRAGRYDLLFAGIGYWLVGFCAAYALAFFSPLGAGGVWAGLSLGTFVYATLLILRFRRLTKRLSAAGAREGADLP